MSLSSPPLLRGSRDPAWEAQLVARYALSVVAEPPEAGYYLRLDAEGLALHRAGPRPPGAVRVDFAGGALAHRRRFGGGRGQPLARAVGMRPGFDPWIWDATAGLGRDAFVCASLGCRVTLCERSPWLAALLEDGLRRAAADPELAPWLTARMQLCFGDAAERLAVLPVAERPDTVYLDPMYPPGKPGVQVKKGMRALQELIGPDRDSLRLLEVALRVARRRVVVKRPRRAGWLHDLKPAASIESPKTRYDVYVT
ncbi:class I SAM-dependent methyltransferase [Thiohalobacter sp. IOR34]|uniref:class I SAM-dependent methyltransferase n=1 Tax=Thiohalobacter sp. IOR34 TaxID=3057176 RepID=UPI0025B1D54E|nr:class I SAM-dependent methyltransferase [Thiohalobacter sp. IOR34]WJW74809.1 class I SAM-dependent methyltransferase [Thiohalobacter sp. IOR34]